MAARRILVAGGHTTPFLGKGNPNFIWKKHPDFGKRENPGLRELLSNAVRGCLAATGVEASQVDRVYVSNFAGELFNQQGHLGAALAGADPGFLYKPAMRIEGACASGGLALAAALDALRAGSARMALVVGAEMQTAASARDGGLFLARAADFHRQSSLDDFTFPCLLARRTKAYMEKYPNSFSPDDALCKIVEKAYGNGNLNPNAHMHAVKIDAEAAKEGAKNPKFLSNEEYKPFLRLTDCSQVSDGASALLLCTEEGLRETGVKAEDAAEIVGLEYGCGNLWEDAPDLSRMDTAHAVVSRLYEQTGLSVKDLGVAEVHDCFSIAELLMYEAMGLAEPGQGSRVLHEGRTHLSGDLPVNTGGGLISFGHPVGATGVKQVHEVFRQMKGQCDKYQVAKRPEHGMTINMGGDDKTIVATMLRNLA